MDWEKVKSVLYTFGIMVGIVLVTALLVSQVIMPIAVGKAKEVIVPDLVGKNLNEANTASTESQLHISEASYVSNSQYGKGVIISQDPQPGTKIKADGTISVIISSGAQQATVPDVVGLAIPQAMARVKNAGLKPVLKDTLSTDQMESDHVLKIWPAGGLTVSPGTRVYITVSASNGETNPPPAPAVPGVQ